MTTTESAFSLTDGEMLDRLRRAAPGKIGSTNAITDLRLLRELIAEGIPFDGVIVPAVAETVAGLKRPLGSWAKFVIDAIRNRAAADGYGPGASTTPGPTDDGPTVAIPGSETRWSVDEVTHWAARWCSDRYRWHDCLGEPPDRSDSRRSPEFQAALDAGRAETVAAVEAWATNPSTWNAERLGPAPDSMWSRLAPEFVEGVRLRDAACPSAAALERFLRMLGRKFDGDAWEHEFIEVFRALPSPIDAEDCTLPPEWQIRALEYRSEGV